MLREAFAVLLVAVSCTAAAETPAPTHVKKELKPMHPSTAAETRQDMTLRVSFKIRERELQSSGNFVVESGTQANYVAGSDEPYERENAGGRTVEFKKLSTIVNVLPVIHPDANVVDSQVQIEISGPLASKGSLRVQPISNFQLQTEFHVALGKTIVLVDEPDRRVELTIEEAK